MQSLYGVNAISLYAGLLVIPAVVFAEVKPAETRKIVELHARLKASVPVYCW